MSDQRLFVGQSQPARRGAAGNDQRARQDGLLAQAQLERTLAEVGLHHVSHAVVGAEAPACLRMFSISSGP